MSTTLSKSSAYLIARTDAQTEQLRRLSLRLGFGHVEALFTRKDFQRDGTQPPLSFFLLYRQMSDELVVLVRNVIRRSADPNVRFSPIILLTDECDMETYVHFVRLGFDDVLTLPDKREMLVHRLEQQVNAEQTYFETADYVGPDRRRLELPDHIDPRRGGEPHSYVKHTVRRSVSEGSKAVRSIVLSTADAGERSIEQRALQQGRIAV